MLRTVFRASKLVSSSSSSSVLPSQQPAGVVGAIFNRSQPLSQEPSTKFSTSNTSNTTSVMSPPFSVTSAPLGSTPHSFLSLSSSSSIDEDSLSVDPTSTPLSSFCFSSSSSSTPPSLAPATTSPSSLLAARNPNDSRKELPHNTGPVPVQSQSVVGARARSVHHHTYSLPALEILITGEANAKEFNKASLGMECDLPSRDLRVVDSAFPDQLPGILARRKAILVNLHHVKAVIQADRVLLFDHAHPLTQALIPDLLQRIRYPETVYQSSASLPFEFRVLESIFISVVDAISEHLDGLEPPINELLEVLTHGPNEKALTRLLALSNSLSAFQSNVSELRRAFGDVLSSDEDLDMMYLTAQSGGVDSILDESPDDPQRMTSGMAITTPFTPATWAQEGGMSTGNKNDAIQSSPYMDRQGGRATAVFMHEELELLMETYLKQMEETYMESKQLHSNIISTQATLKIGLDAVRNHIMRLNLGFTLATLSLAMGAFVTSAFGQNLTIGFEDHPTAFYYVTGGAAAGSLLVLALGMVYLRRSKII